MSGIEIAGIVLAAFPILIGVLEKYYGMAERVGRLYEIRSQHKRSMNKLRFNRIMLERNLELVLSPLFADKIRVRYMIANPGGPEWHNPAIQQALEERLQGSYSLYLETLQDMQQTMQNLNTVLSIDNPQIQSYIENERDSLRPSLTSRLPRLPNLKFEYFRVKFTTREKKRTRLFSELEDCNNRLDKLVSTSDSVSNLRATLQKNHSKLETSAMITGLCKFWTKADQLYRALVGAWGCTCFEQHYAHLVLQHRQPLDNDFLLYFYSGKQNGSGVATSGWSKCSVRFYMHERAQTMGSDLPLQESIDNNRTEPLPPTLQRQLHQPTGTVFSTRNGVITSQNSSHETNNPVPQNNTSALEILPEQAPPASTENVVYNLCTILGTSIKPRSFIECQGDVYYHLASEEWPAVHSNICLSAILSGAVERPTRSERYHLSTKIASSFVQLKGTPWLQPLWDKDSVYFFRAKDHDTLLLDSPFIIQSFIPRLPTTTPEDSDYIRSIVSLGILLLELHFGMSIDKHPYRLKYPKGDGQTKDGFDLFAALKLLEVLSQETRSDYFNAVTWCLAGCRNLSSSRMWRELMVEKVVVPLERCCH